MNILIVDGNEKQPSDDYLKLGMGTQYDVYSKILQRLANDSLNITVIHPAINSNFIPQGTSLDDFEGVAWTGSLLNIYEATPAIIRQIELAKKLLNKKNSIFGSCWGLQVYVTAAGGSIRKNPKGREIIIARNIQLNENGKKLILSKENIFISLMVIFGQIKLLKIISAKLNFSIDNKIQKLQDKFFH